MMKYLCCSEKGSVAEWLGEGGRKMEACDMKASDLVHVRTVPYDLDCNWKVFNDNYLVSMPFISLPTLWNPSAETGDAIGQHCASQVSSVAQGRGEVQWKLFPVAVI